MSGPPTGFVCNQTPLQFKDTFDISGITVQANPYGNAAARLWALTPGAGAVSNPYDTSGGILVDENIQNSFTLNSVTYNLIDMRFFNGQHSIFPWADISGQCGWLAKTGSYTVAPVEAYIFFKNNMNQVVCVVLPIGINDAGSTHASSYINALGGSPGTALPLSTLFQDLSGATATSFNSNNMVLQYIGQDIRTYASTTCDPTSLNNPVTYLVIINDIGDLTTSPPAAATKLLSTTIRSSEYAALVGKVYPSPTMTLNDTITQIDSSTGNLVKLSFLGGGVFYVTNSNTGAGASTVTTNSLKCYPVDPAKDVENGQINLDENGRPIPFPDQIEFSAVLPAVPTPGWSWSSGAGIETAISIAVSAICICVCIYGLRSWWFIDATGTNITAGEAISASVKTTITSTIPTGIQSTASWIGSIFSNKVTLYIIGAIAFISTFTLAILGIFYTIEHM